MCSFVFICGLIKIKINILLNHYTYQLLLLITQSSRHLVFQSFSLEVTSSPSLLVFSSTSLLVSSSSCLPVIKSSSHPVSPSPSHLVIPVSQSSSLLVILSPRHHFISLMTNFIVRSFSLYIIQIYRLL